MNMWGLIRDDELYEAYRTKRRATGMARTYRPGSKHKWRVVPIVVEAWHESK